MYHLSNLLPYFVLTHTLILLFRKYVENILEEIVVVVLNDGMSDDIFPSIFNAFSILIVNFFYLYD